MNAYFKTTLKILKNNILIEQKKFLGIYTFSDHTLLIILQTVHSYADSNASYTDRKKFLQLATYSFYNV